MSLSLDQKVVLQTTRENLGPNKYVLQLLGGGKKTRQKRTGNNRAEQLHALHLNLYHLAYLELYFTL